MMILQHLIFSDSGLEGTEPLYSSSHTGRFPIELSEGESVDFYGYFNYLSLDRWCKYLNPEDIFLNISGEGIADVEFHVFTESYDVVFTDSMDLGFKSKIMIPLYKNGLLGVKISAKSSVRMNDLSYCCDKDQFPEICIGIDLCTYHREEFVDRKIDSVDLAIQRYAELKDKVMVCIIDNGSTIDLDRYDSDHVHVFHNKNTGGSGGFTRGILEISKDPNITHILIMDDDTIMEPETLYRTWSFLTVSYSKDSDIMLGGLMFSLEETCKVVEGSSTFKEGRLYPNKKDVDASSLSGCLNLNIEDSANYNGWWYCVYPVSYANADNLPMQLFMKMDDVEYGVRSNFNVVILNGISVWHLDFNKKYSEVMTYYTFRNILIISKKLGVLNFQLKLIFLKKIISFLFCLKYKNVEFILQALEDYLKGYSWVSEQDATLYKNLLLRCDIFKKNTSPLKDTRKDNCFNKSTFFRLLTCNGILLSYTCSLSVDTCEMKDLYGVSHVDFFNYKNESYRAHRNVLKAFRLLFLATSLIIKIK